jgi:hypothetical protein
LIGWEPKIPLEDTLARIIQSQMIDDPSSDGGAHSGSGPETQAPG